VTGNTHSLERHRDRGTAAQAHTRMYGRRKELPASTRAPPETTTPPSLLHFPRGIGEVPQNYNLGFVINGVSSCCIVSTSFH
jgi:lipid-binding SYLF domain-containing protein